MEDLVHNERVEEMINRGEMLRDKVLTNDEFTFLGFTNPVVVAKAIRTCWASYGASDSVECIIGEKDQDLIRRVGFKHKHGSTLEHCRITLLVKSKDQKKIPILVNVFETIQKECIAKSGTVIKNNNNEYLLCYNLRMIVESSFENEVKHLFIPKAYLSFLEEEMPVGGSK